MRKLLGDVVLMKETLTVDALPVAVIVHAEPLEIEEA